MSLIGSGWHLKLAITAAAAAAGTLILTGCGGKADQSGASDATSTPTAGTTLTVGEQQAPPSLNPGSEDLGYVDFTMLAYASLFYLTPSGSVQPWLAQSYHYVGTGNTELDITLRQGAKFSDGSAVTAAAVVASLNYAKNSGGDQSHYLAGATFTATGALTLTIKLTQPDPILPYLLTQSYGIGQIIGPKGLANASGLTAAGISDGAGPYTYTASQSVAGTKYTYTATPDYWDPSMQHFKKVVITVFSQEQAAVDAAETGQVDIFKGDYTSAAQAKSAGLQVIANPSILNGLYLIDRGGKDSKPLASLKVRQAINYAIDRQAVTTALLGTYGTATDETVVPGGDGYSTPDADYYPYDPAKARQLLTEAGYPHGFTLSVATAAFAGFNTMAQAVQGQLAKVGITLKLTVETSITNLVTDETDEKYPATSTGFQEEPMYLEGLDLFMPGSKVFNGFGTSSSTLTSLWSQAAAATGNTEKQLDQQIEQYLVENAWFAPVSWTPVAYYARSGYGGVATSAGAPFASPLAWYATKLCAGC